MAWIDMRFRGSTTVFARCDRAGNPQVRGGLVEIRYRRGDAKLYRASQANLAPIDGAVPFDDPSVDGAAAAGGDDEPTDEAAAKAPKPRARPAAARKAKVAGEPGAATHGPGVTPSRDRAEGARGPSGGEEREARAGGGPPVVAPDGPSVLAYADGACTGNPGPAGLGVLLLDGRTRWELSEYLGHGTNNIGELTAVLRVLEVVPATRSLEVKTDSQYAIGVLSKGWKAKANVPLVERIKAMLRNRRAHLTYVRGHAGIAGNERADELARAAVEARGSAGWQRG